MASEIKILGESNEIPHCPNKSVGIVVSEYYDEVTSKLLAGAIDTLTSHGIEEKDIYIRYVPGAFELPLGCKSLFSKFPLDAVLALGCVIKGQTDHDKYINQAVANAIMDLNMEKGVPFVFGLITPNTMEQALDRAGGKHGNKGIECAIAALKMMAV